MCSQGILHALWRTRVSSCIHYVGLAPPTLSWLHSSTLCRDRRVKSWCKSFSDCLVRVTCRFQYVVLVLYLNIVMHMSSGKGSHQTFVVWRQFDHNYNYVEATATCYFLMKLWKLFRLNVSEFVKMTPCAYQIRQYLYLTDFLLQWSKFNIFCEFVSLEIQWTICWIQNRVLIRAWIDLR